MSLCLDDHVTENPQLMCEMLADFLSTVYKIPPYPISNYYFMNNCNFITVQVTATKVDNILKNLGSSKGSGPHMIPLHVIKLCTMVLAPHLSVFLIVLLAEDCSPLTSY